MGIEIEINHMQKQEGLITRLLVYYRALEKASMEAVSLSKPLSEAISGCKPNRRSMKLEQIFYSVLERYPEGVIVKDIDVLFNPDYQVDILRLLTETYKRKRYSVIWPGARSEGKLIYGEEGYRDYKVYDINKYDITCVI